MKIGLAPTDFARLAMKYIGVLVSTDVLAPKGYVCTPQTSNENTYYMKYLWGACYHVGQDGSSIL